MVVTRQTEGHIEAYQFNHKGELSEYYHRDSNFKILEYWAKERLYSIPIKPLRQPPNVPIDVEAEMKQYFAEHKIVVRETINKRK